MAADFVTIVSGLARSGTSLMVRMLHASGPPALSDGQRTAFANNPRGCFGCEPVMRLRSGRSWLPQARGHAVKIIRLLLRELLLDGSLQYRIVFMRPPIEEVLASQPAMLRRDGKAGADPAMLKAAFESQLAQLAVWLTGQPRVAMMAVQHPQVMHERWWWPMRSTAGWA